MLKCNNIKLRQCVLPIYSKYPLPASASIIPSTALALLRLSLLHTLLLLSSSWPRMATALISPHTTIQCLRISSVPQRQIRVFIRITQRDFY